MISVITPTYNRPQLLKQAIDSFIRQDYKDKEMIIVNDGSTEGYIDIQLFINERPEIKFLNHVENMGCPHSLNTGIQYSKGDLICILADDDLLDGDDSFSARAKAFEDPEVEVIYTGAYNVDITNKVLSEQRGKPVDKDAIWRQDYINIQSMMWRRSVHDKIGYFSVDLINNEDWEWKIKCLMECNVKMLDILSVRSRYHGQNKSLIDRYTTNKCAHILLKRMNEKYGK
jgi:glycosyltransferase involved in cell wall biosynthesis